MGIADKLIEGLGAFNKSLNGSGQLSADDIVRLQQGKSQGGGVLGALSNINLIGSQTRAAQRQLDQENEDRDVSNALKRAQTEYQLANAGYKSGMLDINQQKTDIARYEADLKAAEGPREFMIALMKMEQEAEKIKIAAQNAATSATNAATTEARLKYDQDKTKYEQEYQAARDKIEDAYKEMNIRIQRDWLKIGQEAAPSQNALRESQTAENVAQTDKISQQMGQDRLFGLLKNVEQMGKSPDIFSTGVQRNYFQQQDGEELAGTEVSPASFLESLFNDEVSKVGEQKSQSGTVMITDPQGRQRPIAADMVDEFFKSPDSKGWSR